MGNVVRHIPLLVSVRRLATLLCVALLALVAVASPLDDALASLDAAIEETSEYDRAYISDIERTKSLLSGRHLTRPEQYVLTTHILNRYRYFNADSAMAWANRALQLATVMRRPELVTSSRLDMVDILARSGLYVHAITLLDSLAAPADSALRVKYYNTRYDLNQYLSEYTEGSEFAEDYARLKRRYADSLLAVLPADDFLRHSVHANRLIELDGRGDLAIPYINDILQHYHPGQREYSIMMSLLAYAFQQQKEQKQASEALARAARSDIMASLKENMAIRSLASVCYDSGDIDRANRYLHKSFDDANYYSARMRNNQAAILLPMVSTAYDSASRTRLRSFSYLLIAIALLAIIMLSAYILIRRGHRRLKESYSAREEVSHSLAVSNEALLQANTQLTEANRVKEIYVGQFMWLASQSINNMERYRNRLVLLAKKQNLDELNATLTSSKEINEAMRKFYQAFDEAFLSIFPGFVDGLNALLLEPLPQRAEGTSTLSTEQRIFALLRLGMADNRRVADFLRCSLSTVFTYRSRVKARARSPQTFDADVLRL